MASVTRGQPARHIERKAGSVRSTNNAPEGFGTTIHCVVNDPTETVKGRFAYPVMGAIFIYWPSTLPQGEGHRCLTPSDRRNGD